MLDYISKTRRGAIVALAGITSTFLFSSCGGGDKTEPVSGGASGSDGDGDKPIVVATTTMLADMLKAISGEHAEVRGLMGPGIDPHLYKPGASDITALRKADAIFYNGLHLEGKMGELFEKMADSGKPVIAVGELAAAERLLNDPEAGSPDPHIWGDAVLWGDLAVSTATAMGEILPDHAADFTREAEAFQVRCAELQAWAKDRIESLPADGRVLITSHDAFAYLGRSLGLEVIGVQGISTVSEPGLADVARTVDFIKERGVRAIFVESSVSPAVIKRISTDAGISIGGELFSDAMGQPGELMEIEGTSYDLGTYEGMMRHNVHLIAEGLSGKSAPPAQQ